MTTMVSSVTIDNKPIKCTLTRIINEFNDIDERQRYSAVLKDYVYDPNKRVIA